MNKKTAAIAGGIGVIGAALGVAYLATKPTLIVPVGHAATTSTFGTSLILTATSTDVVQGIPVTFNASLTQNLNPIPDAIVKFTGLGSPILSTTSPLGIAKRTITIKTPGNYTITASYKVPGISTTASVPITVSRLEKLSELKLKASGTAVLEGGSIKFTITALNSYNTPLPGTSGVLLLNGTKSASFTTGKTGSTTFTLAFDNSGSYNVQASANNIDSDVITVGVNYSYSLSLQVSSTGTAQGTTHTNQQVGTFVYWIAKVTGAENGGNASGITVHFSPMNQNVTTGSTGVAIVRTTYSAAGTYVVTAQAFAGNNPMSPPEKASASIDNNFKLSLTPTSPTINAGGSVTFGVGAVNGINGISVPFTIYVNGAQVGSGATASGSGSGTFSQKFSTAGTYTVHIAATFGNETYNAYSTVTVKEQLSSYTCYYCQCKQMRTPSGYQNICIATTSYTRSTPCPNTNAGGYSSAAACCDANPCP